MFFLQNSFCRANFFDLSSLCLLVFLAATKIQKALLTLNKPKLEYWNKNFYFLISPLVIFLGFVCFNVNVKLFLYFFFFSSIRFFDLCRENAGFGIDRQLIWKFMLGLGLFCGNVISLLGFSWNLLSSCYKQVKCYFTYKHPIVIVALNSAIRCFLWFAGIRRFLLIISFWWNEEIVQTLPRDVSQSYINRTRVYFVSSNLPVKSGINLKQTRNHNLMT